MNRCFLGGLAVFFALTGPASASSDKVTIRATDQSIELEGDLLSFDDETLVVRTIIGNISVRRSEVKCEGEACPSDRFDADMVFAGSDTVARNLMPLLIEGYADTTRAQIVDRVDLGDGTLSMNARDSGDGDTLFTVSIRGEDSNAGFEGMLASANDIAMSSRPAKPPEIQALRDQGRGNLLAANQDYVVAFDSVAIVVSPKNPVDELTEDQLTGIFSGRLWNWRQVGGQNEPINVYTQDKSSGTYAVFNQAALTSQGSRSPNMVRVNSSQEMARRVAADPAGVGYVGFGSVGEAKSLDLITSCGLRMTPSSFAAKAEEYILQSRLRLFVDNSPKPEHMDALLDYAVSSRADAIVRKSGFVDLSVEEDRSDARSQRLFEAATAATEVPALRTLRKMTLELHNANRLSTTFRFERGSLDLDTKSERDLVRVAEFLNRTENRNRDVLLVGFTDSDGDFSANVELSEQRAQKVLERLQSSLGSASGSGQRLTATGYGELSPVGCNEFADGRRRNRRVEIWLH
ncbi:MAG: phosphate ABC transporter substrate-binding/OmpA family protein [Pseudomonadota bacterium]